MEKELLEALGKLLDEKLDEKLAPIHAKLDEHSQILNEHSQILNEHSQRLEEHSQILRALEHSAEIAKAERDAMANDIAHIKGDVASIRKDLCRVEEATANNWSDIARLKAIK